MMRVSSGETYQLPAAPNQIETVLAEKFGDPALWSADRHMRMTVGELAGLKSKPYVGENAYEIGDRPGERWVTLLYGTRVIGDSIYPSAQAEFETASLKTMVAMHAHLAETVLAGEHMRPSVLVKPPKPFWLDIRHKDENNQFWLEKIESGVWPIMATYLDSDETQKTYYSHDYSSNHTVMGVLLPMETQDLITKTATHELAQFKKYRYGNEPRIMALDGDTELSPFGLYANGTGEYLDGMAIIDGVTEMAMYVKLLHYLMNGDEATPELRLAAVEAFAQTDRTATGTPLSRATPGLTMLQKYTGIMVNFISRHENGRNATQEEVDAEIQSFKIGAVRVAKKISGTYDPNEVITLEPVVPIPSPSVESTVEPVQRRVGITAVGMLYPASGGQRGSGVVGFKPRVRTL